MGEMPLAPEKLTAQFFFELMDRPGQGRRCYIALLGSAGEIQGIAGSQKIADLVRFHCKLVPPCWTHPQRLGLHYTERRKH